MIFTLSEWAPEAVAVVAVLVVCARCKAMAAQMGLTSTCGVRGRRFFFLACWHSRRVAEAAGYDLSLPSLSEALETYISTGNGNLTDIIEGHRYPPIMGFRVVAKGVEWLMQTALHNV